MTTRIGTALLLLITLCSVILEGLWNAVPPAFVQFNGLILLLSALTVLGLGARSLLKTPS